MPFLLSTAPNAGALQHSDSPRKSVSGSLRATTLSVVTGKACQRPFARGNFIFSCYRCVSCLHSSAEYWRDRQDLEYQDTRDRLGRGSSFITLTYAPAHLPTAFLSDQDGKVVSIARNGAELEVPEDCSGDLTGFRHPAGILLRSELDRFLRTLRQRLRRYGGHAIRYSAVGEYGEKHGRCHYHAVLYGYAPTQRIGALTFAEHVHAAWGKGRTQCGPVLKGGSHYVSGYITSPRSVAGHPSLEGRPPEFSSRSRLLGGGAVDTLAKTFADNPYCSSVEDGQSKPITIRTEFREVWLRKSLLRRFFTSLGYADAADAKPVQRVQPLAAREAFILGREFDVVETRQTILSRANAEKVWDGTRILASRRSALLEGGSNSFETTSELCSELYGDRVAQLVAANAAYQSHRASRSPF